MNRFTYLGLLVVKRTAHTLSLSYLPAVHVSDGVEQSVLLAQRLCVDLCQPLSLPLSVHGQTLQSLADLPLPVPVHAQLTRLCQRLIERLQHSVCVRV